ncbi:PAS domain S-box protein [Halonotius sp. F2-221B]|uniref:PAS domain S-box protein n=1 Tax=Halonotius sp. F2-221B TaxID=2731620 RepID=UPI00398B5E68
MEADRVADQMQSSLPAGIVFLEQRPNSDVIDHLPSETTDIPRIVVGPSIDSPELYDAGVTDIIPFGIESQTAAIAEQIERVLDRAHNCIFTQDLLNQTNHGIVVHHPETGEIITCNDQFYRMLGYDPATTTLSLSDLVGHNEEFTEERAVEMVHRAASGVSQTFAWPDPTNDGNELWVEVKIQAAQLYGSKYVVSSVRDISGRKAKQQQLEANQAALERLQKITADPSADLTAQVKDLLQFGADLLGTEIGFLSRINEKTNHFEIAEAVGDHPLIQSGSAADLSETYCRRTIRPDTGSPLVYDDAANEGMADDPAYEKFDLGCYMGAKVTVDDELYGTICFADSEPRTEPFSDMEQTILDYMSQWLQQELERREYLEEVEAARERNDRLLERIDDAFFAVDENWHVQYVNDGGGDVLRQAMETDYGDDELIGKHLWDGIPDAVETTFYEEYHRALSEQVSVTFEERYDPLDVWFEVRAYPDEQGLSIFFTDITERKQREQERYILERAMKEASLPLTLSDPGRADNPLVFVNDAFEETTGYEADEILGQNCRFLQGPETDPETVAALREHIEAEKSYTTEIKNYRQDGSTFWNQLDITPIYDEDGTLLRYLGSQSDITEAYRNREIRRQLLSTTQELMNANTGAEIADIVADAAVDILDHELTVVYRADEFSPETLTPTSWSDRIEAVFDGPLPPTDGGALLEAYDTGEPIIIDDVSAYYGHSAAAFDPVESLLFIPLGEYGVLGVGGYDPHVFDEVDIERAQLLTVNATSAFSRMDRRQELEQYETLFETVQEKRYAVNSEGYIELVSEPLATAVGKTPAKLEGEHISTILTEDTERERRDVELHIRETAQRSVSSYEGHLRSTTGANIPVEIDVSLLPYDEGFRGAVGAVRDISERRQREAELRVFQKAITEAGIGLTMYDETGRFEYLNDHYAQVVGRTRETLLDASIWETVSERSAEAFDTYWNSFAVNETRTEETKHIRADGSTVVVESTTTAVEIDGSRHHLMLVQEITGQRERRQQSQVLHRVLRHNLRNDLTVVLGRTNILLEELTGQAATHAEIIEKNASKLLGTVEAASDAREVINQDIVRKPVDAVSMLQGELDAVENSFDGEITIDLPDERFVLADTPLRRGFYHLLTNAVEHNDATNPQLSVRITDADDRVGWVAIEIEDNGPGIPPEELDVLTAGEETDLNHGSGVGLWVVNWVVTRYGGELSFETPPEGGSLVRIMLPAAEKP